MSITLKLKQMKKLIIALVLGIGLTGFAQENTTKPRRAKLEQMTPEQRHQQRLKHLTKELNLDANQQKQVDAIITEKRADAEKMKAEKANRANMAKEQKMALRKTRMAERDDIDARMKGILSADQYTKWKALQEKNEAKVKEERKAKEEAKAKLLK
jgi:CHASE1-domain containing sensor protein